MADGDEGPIACNHALLAGDGIGHGHAGQPAAGRIADKVIDCLVPGDRDLFVGKQPVLQDLFRAEGIAAVDHRHVGRMVGEIERLFNRRIAAADHHDLLAAIEETIAGGAGRYALAAQFLLARNTQPARLGAGRDHQGFAFIDIARIAGRPERRARQVDVDDGVPQHAGADMFCLSLHFLHQPGPLDDIAETGIVLDISGDGQLPARLQPLDDDGLHPGAGAIDRGRKPCGAGTDDEHAGSVDCHGNLRIGGGIGTRAALCQPPAAVFPRLTGLRLPPMHEA